jgi:type IV secretory pathway TrbL component
MTRFVTSTILSAALLAGAAASAYAAGPQPDGQWWSYSAAGYGQKASGGANTPSTHFQKPPGYDQNPANFPYARPGSLKAN